MPRDVRLRIFRGHRMHLLAGCSTLAINLLHPTTAQAVSFYGQYSFTVGNQPANVASYTGPSVYYTPYFTSTFSSGYTNYGQGYLNGSDIVSTVNGAQTDKANVQAYTSGGDYYNLAGQVDYLQTITNTTQATQDYTLQFSVFSDLQNDFRTAVPGPLAATDAVTLSVTANGSTTTRSVYQATLTHGHGSSGPFAFSETGTSIPSTLYLPDGNQSPAYEEYKLTNLPVIADLGDLAPGQSLSVDLEVLSDSTGSDPAISNAYGPGRSTAQIVANNITVGMTATAVPEPASAALLGAGLLALSSNRRFRPNRRHLHLAPDAAGSK